MTTISAVVAMTGRAFSVSVTEMTGARGDSGQARARQAAMYLARKMTGASYPAIGAAFGMRNHTTVIHDCAVIEAAVKTDAGLKAALLALEHALAFQDRLAAAQDMDVLALARSISLKPERMAIGASVLEIAALAHVLLDLWELARAADALARLCLEPELEEADGQAKALAGAIIDDMAALCGDRSET